MAELLNKSANTVPKSPISGTDRTLMFNEEEPRKIKLAMKQLKNGTASGAVNLPSELFNADCDICVQKIYLPRCRKANRGSIWKTANLSINLYLKIF